MSALLTPERISLSKRFVATALLLYIVIFGITITVTIWLGQGG
jgi:hypothetical protein